MSIAVVHYSLFGGTRAIAERMKYNAVSLSGYIDRKDQKIIILARRFYGGETSAWAVQEFVKEYKHKILGVIIVDDKNYGVSYADYSSIFIGEGLRILAVLDRLVSDNDIKHLEEIIDEKI